MPGGRPEGLLPHGRLTAVVPFVSDIPAYRGATSDFQALGCLRLTGIR